jgi:hypothetical protein
MTAILNHSYQREIAYTGPLLNDVVYGSFDTKVVAREKRPDSAVSKSDGGRINIDNRFLAGHCPLWVRVRVVVSDTLGSRVESDYLMGLLRLLHGGGVR